MSVAEYLAKNKLCQFEPMAPWTDLFNNSQTIAVRDPLILDLDGDGVETTNVKDGAYFDHDGNGFAEKTGWASSDDGLLVMDRNSDDIINNGTELFGDQTILSSGQTATDGFQALAELDSNADGIIDVNDTAFSQLKIWQDIDGDGYSASEYNGKAAKWEKSLSYTNFKNDGGIYGNLQ